MSRSRMLAYGFGVVLVAAILLVVATHRSAKPARVASTTPTTASGAPGSAVTPPRAPLVNGKVVPVVTEGIDQPTALEPPPVHSYMVDGMEVHDHRTGTHAELKIAPVYPPNARRINVEVTRAITNQLQAAINECAKAIPPEARGSKPKVEGQILIAITKGQVSLTRTAFVMKDFVGASVEPVQACIEQKAGAISVQAPDEPDVAAYPISLSLAII